MAYSPPKKITVIISFLFLLLGFLLVISIYWIPEIYDVLPAIALGGLSKMEFYVIIALVLIFLSWILFFIGINYRGI